MVSFITGVVEENLDGATYQGSVWDRTLLLRLPSGELLSIFDGFDRISEDLKPGATHEVLLSPMTIKVVLAENAAINANSNPDMRFGEIVDLHWQANKGDYQFSIPTLYEGDWILVATRLGQMIFRIHDFEESLRPKLALAQMITWKHMRLDLCAVV